MESLTINKKYAAQYEKKKRAEELSRLREKYGDVATGEDSDSSSSDEEEDETAVEVTNEQTRDFLRTLSLLKQGDARIYDKDVQFFQEPSSDHRVNKPEKVKPVYLKDYERLRLLEKGELAGLSDDEEEDEKRGILAYNDEQKQLKSSFDQAVREAEDGDDEDDVLTLRHKSTKELEQEEADYIKWLKGQPAEVSSAEVKDMDTLHRFWTDPNLDKDEVFLRDYILNRGWVDTTECVPTYQEILEEQPDVSDDEEAIEEQDEFERQYNFRFEEPDKETIIRYPRAVSGSVRKPDDHRKLKRKAKEERMLEEKKRKQDELKRLKNLKRQEIREKLDKLKEITGNATVGFNDSDIEGDFDPAAHDAAMNLVFSDDYYQREEDGEKPVFTDSEEEDVNWDEWVPETAGDAEPHCEDPDFNMDAEYDPTATTSQPTVKKKRGRRQSKFAQVVMSKKQTYNPEEDTYDHYMDEYYQLEYEDLIGDLPCRFKYRQVEPNDFGLTTEEILRCDDRELNKWASLKKTVQYRTAEEERKDVKDYRKKGRNQEKKQRILASYYHQDSEEEAEKEKGEGHGRKRKRKEKDGKPRKKRKEVHSNKKADTGLEASRLAAYGLTSKKNKRKKNKKK